MDSKSADELAKSIQAVKSAAQDTTNAFEEQLRIMSEMRDVMSQISGNIRDVGSQNQSGLFSPDNVKNLSKELDKLGKNSKGATRAIESINNVIKNKLVKTLIFAEAGLKGFSQGFMGIVNLQKGVFSFLGGVVGGLFKVGRAILAIPFKMMDGLFNMAKRGNDNSYAQALEEVREQFGDLKSESAKTVIDLSHNMDKFNNTGVSSWKIWGNAAEKLKAVNEFAKGMGPTFQVFEKEIAENGEAIMRYQKGLGITNEQMASIGSTAMRMGKGIEQVQNEMTKQALGMSKAFGVNAKVISKDMAKAMQDLSHFGHLSTKELGIAATFANKLGISVDKLTGMMDATKTFDQAAEGMSKLNEQYGTNIDASKIMMAQSPAEKFALISKGFRDAGKDLSKLTIQDKDFIKAQSGMTDEALNAMIANKNAGDMFDKMQKQGDKNEKKTLSQADAMKDLAESITRLTKTGEAGRGGILQHFLDGIARGLQTTPEFRNLMRNINIIFRDAIMYGVKLGKMIFGLDNGLSGIVGGLTKAFDPQRYRKMFQGVLDAFSIFHKGGEDRTKNFMDKLHEVFFDFFKSDAPAGKKMLGGFAKFGQTLVAVFAGIGSWVVKKLTDIIPEITKIIPSLFGSLRKGAKEFDPKQIKLSAPAWAAPLIDLFDQIKKQLVPVLKDLFKAIWKEVGPLVKEGLKVMFLSALAVGAFKAVLNMAFTALAGVLWNSLLVAMGGTAAAGASAGIATAIGTAISGALSIVAAGFTAILGSVLAPALIVAAVAYSAVKVGDAIKTYGKVLEDKGFDPATAKIAAGTTGLINTLTLGLLPEDLQLKIAESFAKMYKWIFDGLTKIFGPSFTTSIKEALSGAFQAFGGLGDLISSMWKGDSKGVEQALRDICEGILKGFLAGLEFVKIEIPLAIAKLSVWVLKGIASLAQLLFNKIGDIFVSLERIPLVGPLLGLIGDIFHKLGTVAGGLKDLFGGVLAFLKLIDVPAWFKSAGEAISNFFKNSKDGANGFLVGIFDWGKQLVSFIETPFRAIREMFNALFSWDLNKSGLENLQNNIKNSFNILTKWWDKWVDQFIGILLDGPIKAKNWIANNFNKETFVQIGKDIIDGLESQIKKIEERFSQPFKNGLKHVKAFLGIHSPSKEMEEIGKNMSAGLSNGTADIPKNMKDTAVDATKAMQDGLGVKGPVSSGGMSPEEIKKAGESVKAVIELTKLVPSDNKIKNKLETLGAIFDSLNKITSSISGSIGSVGASASEAPLQKISDNLKFVFNVLQMLNGEGKSLGVGWTPSFSALSSYLDKIAIGKLSNDKAKKIGDLLESIGKITTSVAKPMDDMKKRDESKGALGSLAASFGFIFNILQVLSGESKDLGFNWLPSLKEISEKLDGLHYTGKASDLISKSNKISGIIDGIGKITTSISSTLTSMSGMSLDEGKGPIQMIGKGLSFIFNILQMLSGDKNLGVTGASLSSISTELDKLKSITIAKENVDSLTRSMERVGRISDSFGVFASKATATSIAGLTANIEAIKSMVTKTRELDTALSTLPKMTFPAKLESIAKGMGLGGKFAYTVQSKEVVINVEFNVTMEVDKVEQILISRTSSIIRDRINYAIDHAAKGDKNTKNAYIKSQGPQTGLVASDVGH